MLNNIILQGRLVNQPEKKVKDYENENSVFSVASKRNFKNKNGDYETDFIPCVAWGNTAHFINKYFIKGSEILLKGRLQQRSYTAKDGTKRYVFEVIVENVFFTYGPKKDEYNGNENMMHFTEVEIEDVPF